MKGIVLAGGLGTRLYPLTRNDNKHLLPVYDKRMVELPLVTLVEGGIKDIILITGGHRPGKFLEIFKNGKGIGADRLYYTYQDGEGGIADALKMARTFMRPKEPCVVILGDNYFENGICHDFRQWNKKGAHVLLKKVDSPWSYGIAEIEGENVVGIEEKPTSPKSNLAIVGCYMFDHTLWSKLEQVEPSKRNELEITEVLKLYMRAQDLTYSFYDGYWQDMGTFENWMEVSRRLSEGTWSILITGCAGFIGSHAVEEFLGADYEVSGLDSMTYAGKVENMTSFLADITFFKDDICDTSRVVEIINAQKIEWIINFAAETHVDNSIEACDNFIYSNIFGVKSLLEACRLTGCKLFQVSTDEVYGSRPAGSFSEESALKPWQSLFCHQGCGRALGTLLS